MAKIYGNDVVKKSCIFMVIVLIYNSKQLPYFYRWVELQEQLVQRGRTARSGGLARGKWQVFGMVCHGLQTICEIGVMLVVVA